MGIASLDQREGRLGEQIVVERVVERHERGPPLTDDATRLLEQVVTVMQRGDRRDRRDRTASPSGVFGGAIATAMDSAPFGAEAVLSGLVLGMGRAPGAVVGSIGHRSDSMTIDGRPLGAMG